MKVIEEGKIDTVWQAICRCGVCNAKLEIDDNDLSRGEYSYDYSGPDILYWFRCDFCKNMNEVPLVEIPQNVCEGVSEGALLHIAGDGLPVCKDLEVR